VGQFTSSFLPARISLAFSREPVHSAVALADEAS
jgi:hypothetical protein